jgi:hypothetical protein
MLQLKELRRFGGHTLVDRRGSPKCKLGCARGRVSGDAKMPAVFGRVCRDIYWLWHFVGDGKLRLVDNDGRLCSRPNVFGNVFNAPIALAAQHASLA